MNAIKNFHIDNIEIHRRNGCEPKGSPVEYHMFYRHSDEPGDITTILMGTEDECHRIRNFIVNVGISIVRETSEVIRLVSNKMRTDVLSKAIGAQHETL